MIPNAMRARAAAAIALILASMGAAPLAAQRRPPLIDPPFGLPPAPRPPTGGGEKVPPIRTVERPRPRNAAFWARSDTAAVRLSVQYDIETVLELSREGWLAAERLRNGVPTPRSVLSQVSELSRKRLREFHCHYNGSYEHEGLTNTPKGPQTSLLREPGTAFSVCPWWLGQTETPRGIAQDVNPDDALSIEDAAQVKAARARAIAALDSASAAHPGSRWFAGQRVRFRVDAGAYDDALAAAMACRSDRSWCAALAGYALSRAGRIVPADSAFAVAGSTLEPGARCRWLSVATMLPGEVRDDFAGMGCERQAAILPVLWWLADPMFSEPGNERRVEHYARQVRQYLHDELPFDEFHDLRRNNRAVALMHLRYGWPTYLWWGGELTQSGHTHWLATDPSPPYSAAEYSRDRISTLPSWAAVLEPFSVADDDFELGPLDGRTFDNWWPWEHFRRRRGFIATINAGQAVLFRRDTAAMLVVAADFNAPELAMRSGERVDAHFMLSRGPDHVTTLATQRVPIGERVLARAMVDSGSALAGIEFLSRTSGGIDGRSRFAISAPPSLASIAPGGAALSEILLFQVPGSDVPMPETTEAAIEGMLASTRLTKPSRVGVFWESYGFVAGDTLDVSVELQRVTSAGKWRRLGAALRLSNAPDGSIRVGWREPSPDRYSRPVPGLSRPTLARQLVLDLSPMSAGDYRLQVTMRKPGGTAVMARRAFTIER